MNKKYVEVAPGIPLSHRSRQTYTYQVPHQSSFLDPLQKFSLVTIPFGPRRVSGLVIRQHNQPPSYPVKSLIKTMPVTLTKRQIQFARWISQTMQGGLGYTLRLFFPPTQTYKPIEPQHYRSTAVPRADVLNALNKGSVAIIDHRLKKRQAIINFLISHYHSQNKQVLTLVPEKHLLPGPGYTYSADLGRRETTAIWHGVKNNNIAAIRGTQKACFLPFVKLGLIVIEEEQYSTHKLWDQYPRLSNIDAAQTLSHLYQCPILFLSSFPSYFLQSGIDSRKITALINKPLSLNPSTIAFSFEDKLKKYALPHDLVSKLRSWTNKRQRTLLLYDRLDNKRLKQAMHISFTTQQLSYCTLSTKQIFTNCKQPFSHTVWLFPEKTISFPDYRSTERFFITISRLHQIASHKTNHVYLVTKRPDLIEQLITDPRKSYQREAKLRQRLLLPPYAHQVRLRISAPTASKADHKTRLVYQKIQTGLAQLSNREKASIIVRGPYQSLSKTDKLHHHYRFIIIRGPLPLIATLYDKLPLDIADLSPANVL